MNNSIIFGKCILHFSRNDRKLLFPSHDDTSGTGNRIGIIKKAFQREMFCASNRIPSTGNHYLISFRANDRKLFSQNDNSR